METNSASWPAPVWVFLALAGYCGLQALPLPVGLLEFLSPVAADIWTHALSPFEERVEWGALSLDPGASLREALKWLLYGLNFFAATLVAKRYGRRVPALIVFGAALIVAVATLGHGLTHATKVFGLYEPTLRGSPWAVGPFLNPNTLSAYLNLGVFIGLGLVFSRRLREYRWLLACGVAALLGITVLSGSRGGVWVLPVGLALFALLKPARGTKRRPPAKSIEYRSWIRNWPLLFPLLGALGLSVGLVVLGANQLTWSQLRQDDLEKLKMAEWSLPLIKDFWAFGAGRGAFATVFSAYAPSIGKTTYLFPENILVQWASEWGIPIALLAVLGFARAFRPMHVSIRGDSLGAGAAVGVAVLLLQNLVDFGLERPATPLAATWALAVLWKPPTKAEPEDPSDKMWAWRGRIALTIGFCFWAGALLFARHDVMTEKRALYQASKAANLRDKADIAVLRRQLRDAMLRTPAEPYFARLGGEVSLSTGNTDVLRWVSRALERGINDPQSHLLAARALQRYGAANQALLELRLATELDLSAVPLAGQLAARWGESLNDLLRAAPAGPAGARVLAAAARHLKGTSKQHLREPALRAALEHDESYTAARQELVTHLAGELKQGGCSSRASCSDDALLQADRLIGETPGLVLGIALKVQMLRTLNRDQEALTLLSRACQKLSGDEARRCLRLQLSVAVSSSSAKPEQVSAIVRHLSDQPCGSAKACAGLSMELGKALQRTGDLAGALEHFERAARQEPSLAALFAVANVAVDLGEMRRAEDALDRALKLASPAQLRQVQSKRAALRLRMIQGLTR